MASVISAGTTSTTALNLSGDTTGVLQLQTNSTTAAMTIDTSQNVGVGTTSPTARLGIPTPLYTSSATGGMIRFQNPDVAADSCIQSFYVTGAGSNIWIGSNNYIDTNGSVVRFSGSYASSAINLSRDGTLAFYTSTGAATERMRIDSSGNVGIGTSTITSSSGWSPRLVLDGTDTALVVKGSSGQENTFGTSGGLYIDSLGHSTGTSNNIIFRNTSTNSSYSASERMRIHSNGYITMGTTNTNIDAGPGFKFIATTNAYIGMVVESSINSQTNYHLYSTGAGTYRFYVGAGGTIYATATTIVAISDVRLKENIQDIDVGLDAIMALKPRKFDWKEGKGKDKKGDRGWIAQEFEQVFPDMIENWKDPAPEGEEPYKAVSADLIPVLVKAIQELNAKVEAQAVEIQALKGAR